MKEESQWLLSCYIYNGTSWSRLKLAIFRVDYYDPRLDAAILVNVAVNIFLNGITFALLVLAIQGVDTGGPSLRPSSPRKVPPDISPDKW
jgi:hypothetical protein